MDCFQFRRGQFVVRLILLSGLLSGFASAQNGGPAGAPPNDLCRDSIVVTNGNTNFSTVGASTDGIEEFPECFFSGDANINSDIWYRYTATCSGELNVDLCNSDYDTKVSVYSGCTTCTFANPPLGCNDDSSLVDCAPQSDLAVPVQSGSCYTIRVGGYLNQSGNGTMNLSCSAVVPTGACCSAAGNCLGTMSQASCNNTGGIWNQGQNCSTFVCPITPPPNDTCNNCIQLTTGQPYDGTTFGATGNTSTCSLNDTKDVWHCWTADCTGRVRISTCGSSFDTTLAAYNGCGGDQLACNDDGCSVGGQSSQSQVQLDVIQGNTYFLRVAGRTNATGSYRIQVESCRTACCINGGQNCQTIFPSQCLNGGGTLGNPGSVCEGDQNFNGIDDACEKTGCPAATIGSATPPSGTVDARQPHPMNLLTARQGIGAPASASVTAEPIDIQLDPPVDGAEGCFSLCETATDPLGSNGINSVVPMGSGVYRITLNRGISMGAITTIQYVGDGSFVQYTSHPANANSDSAANPSDVIVLIDHLNGVRVPPLTRYQCDFDHSGVCGPPDIITLIDLLNGAGGFDPWNGTVKPTNLTCP